MDNKSYNFFAMLARMKYITRWALMRNTYRENISEHSLDVAITVHALCTIRNKRFGGNLNADRAAVLGLFHDCPEIITGDMPTPVKYYSSQIHDAFGSIEADACNSLLNLLPDDLKEEYRPLFFKEKEDEELWKEVKAADKICAYTKCVEEAKAGNNDFNRAAAANLETIKAIPLPEVQCFIEEFLPGFSLTIDEMSQ